MSFFFFFFFFLPDSVFRGGTGENGFREWHNRGKHSINQVKLRGVAHACCIDNNTRAVYVPSVSLPCFSILLYFLFMSLPFFRHACA